MIEAILFDKDGTLYDFQGTYGTWARDLVRELSGDDALLAECLAAEWCLDLATAEFHPDSVVIAGTVDDIADCVLPHLPNAPGRADFIAWIDARAARVRLQEAVPLRAFLEELAERALKLGVVTNDSEAPAKAHLAQTGITEFFGFIAGYDSGFGAKPMPEPLLAGAKALGVAPERVLMVGDSRHDLLAGRAAGMATLGVLTGTAKESDLAPFADVVLPNIGHLPGWLDGTGHA